MLTRILTLVVTLTFTSPVQAQIVTRNVCLGFMGGFFTLASPATAQIVPPGSEVAGKSIGEWTHDWWNWAAPIPSPVWPPVFDDGLSAPANTRQDGPVSLSRTMLAA